MGGGGGKREETKRNRSNDTSWSERVREKGPSVMSLPAGGLGEVICGEGKREKEKKTGK